MILSKTLALPRQGQSCPQFVPKKLHRKTPTPWQNHYRATDAQDEALNVEAVVRTYGYRVEGLRHTRRSGEEFASKTENRNVDTILTLLDAMALNGVQFGLQAFQFPAEGGELFRGSAAIAAGAHFFQLRS